MVTFFLAAGESQEGMMLGEVHWAAGGSGIMLGLCKGDVRCYGPEVVLLAPCS